MSSDEKSIFRIAKRTACRLVRG